MTNAVCELTWETPQLLEKMLELPKNKLELLIKTAGQAKKEKYKHTHPLWYGGLQRTYPKRELELLFKKGFYRKETKRIFLIQFFFALRIGELKHIEPLLQQRVLKIYNEKLDRIDYLPMHGDTWKLFLTPLHIPDTGNLTKTFRNANKKLGFEYIYYQGKDKSGRSFKLSQFTPHSMRRTAITLYINSIQNPLKAMRYSRHQLKKEYACLPEYYYYNLDAMRKDLTVAFKPYYKLIDSYIKYKHKCDQIKYRGTVKPMILRETKKEEVVEI